MTTRSLRGVLLSACSLFAPDHSGAQIVDHNEFASVSAVDAAPVRLTIGEDEGAYLYVRFVNAQGRPLSGLAVDFLTDECLTSGIGSSTCLPHSAYGHFSPAMISPVATDSNGVATANRFVAGNVPATYRVAAIAYPAEAANAPLQGDSMGVFFQVEQVPPGVKLAVTSGLSGAWYDPSQSGHGLLVEVLPSSRILAYWFTFDSDGKQAWFGGDGTIRNDAAYVNAMQGYGGRWIPNFDPANYQLFSWGQLTLTFSDCNHGRVDFVANGESSTWGSVHMDLSRLTSPVGIACP